MFGQKNLKGLTAQTKQFIKNAFESVRSEIKANDYIKYIPKNVIILDGVTNVSKGAFSTCKNIETVTLPDTLKRIESNAFLNCSELTGIDIPEGCEYIGSAAFLACGKIGTIRVPTSVREIQVLTFISNSVEISENNRSYTLIDGVIYNKNVTELHSITKDTPNSFVIPNTVTKIKDSALQKDNITVTIPASVTDLSVHAFASHSNGTKVICKSQAVYDLMINLIEANAGTDDEFKGTVELSID